MEQGAEQPEQMASPGGTLYTLKKGMGKYGYEGVYAPHDPSKGFHVKMRLDEESKYQTTLPGLACGTAKEAALRLAKFRAAPFEIVKKEPDRAPKGESKVAKKRAFEHLLAEEDPEDMPTWVVSQDAAVMWKAGLEPPPSVQLSATAAAEVWRVRAWASSARAKTVAPTVAAAAVPRKRTTTERVPAHAPAGARASTSGSVMQKRVQSVLEQQAGPPLQFDPAVLAHVAAIKAGAVGDGRD